LTLFLFSSPLHATLSFPPSGRVFAQLSLVDVPFFSVLPLVQRPFFLFVSLSLFLSPLVCVHTTFPDALPEPFSPEKFRFPFRKVLYLFPLSGLYLPPNQIFPFFTLGTPFLFPPASFPYDSPSFFCRLLSFSPPPTQTTTRPFF